MSTASEFPSYSADVQMDMRVNGSVVSIGQIGPDFVILDDPTPHPPCQAEIRVSIDGDERRWNVYLPDGISPESELTRIL